MIDIDSNFIEQLNKREKKPVFLYTVFEYDGAEDLNFAESKEDVLYDDGGGEITYQAFPVTHDEIGENTQGEVNAIKVTISNVSRTIQAYLEHYDFRGKEVRIRLVFRDRLAYPDEHLDFTLFVDSYTANQDVAEFLLLPKMNVVGAMLPARVYSRNYCQWKFKSTECGYASGETSCNKTKQRCKELGNYQRFGGFPSIPSKVVIIS